jgi:glycosyltransferase involved in cell wall biosynthesis
LDYEPLISCLCVSKNRPDFLQNAIRNFRAQTYPNKELIIVCDEDVSFPELFGNDTKVVRVQPEPHLTLGEKRNISLDHARGEFFCIWDDDDWYHIRRLETQLKTLITRDKQANVLGRLILYDSSENKAYLSSNRYWEGTLLCKRHLPNFTVRYPALEKGEDNSLVVGLWNAGYLQQISHPYLYIYRFHGRNTWDTHHFNELFRAGYTLSEKDTAVISEILSGNHSFDEASRIIEQVNLNVLPA